MITASPPPARLLSGGFDGSGSYDPDAHLSFAWDLNGDGTFGRHVPGDLPYALRDYGHLSGPGGRTVERGGGTMQPETPRPRP